MSNAATFNCRQIADLMTEYLEGAMPSPERLAFEQHVAACPPCRGYFAQMRTVVRAGRTLSEDELPERVKSDLVDAFREWKRSET